MEAERHNSQAAPMSRTKTRDLMVAVWILLMRELHLEPGLNRKEALPFTCWTHLPPLFSTNQGPGLEFLRVGKANIV